jgi:hypothetical protein
LDIISTSVEFIGPAKNSGAIADLEYGPFSNKNRGHYTEIRVVPHMLPRLEERNNG